MKKLSRTMAVICSVTMLLSGVLGGEKNIVYAADEGKIKIEYQQQDRNVIPDKYNTGTKGKLSDFVPVYNSAIKYYTITAKNSKNEDVTLYLKLSGDEVTYYVDFSYAENKKLSGEIILSDLDFAGKNLRTKEEDKLTNNLSLVYQNCKFEYVRTLYPDSRLKSKFYNCSFYNFNGSNAYFERCAFGGQPNDALNPFRNVEVRACYFSNMNHYLPKDTHIDGTQIYGYAELIRDENGNPILDANGKRQYKNSLDAKNIKFDNCRYEIPNIVYEIRPEDIVEGEDPKVATVNACLMVQLEYSAGYDIHFNNCIVNGGGYTIYSHAGRIGTLSDVSFDNIKVGAGRSFGVIYPDIDPDTKINNLDATDSLYVGSVYKEDGILNLSVTNDTARERKLKVITDIGEKNFTLKAGPTDKTLNTPGYETFDDMPFDCLLQVEGNPKYAVCFDVTDSNNVKQIRFYNDTDEDVYIDKINSGEENVLLSGKCGLKNADVSFTLTNDSVLTISGNGDMDNYHSGKLPPWWEYRDFIKKVVIEDGVTCVGAFSFWDCFALEKVVLADSVKQINGKAFKNCITISDINISNDVKVIDEAFVGAFKYAVANGYYQDEENNNSSEIKNNPVSNNTTVNTPFDKKVTAKTNKKMVKVGSVIKDKKTGFVYKVTSVKKGYKLKLIKCTKKSKKIKVKYKVRANGVNFKVTSIGKKAF
ncbi:MAG: leucine-rich repeat domain-containing protein, partial [Eubacterium sp.]|nr:leucine-rich repeat domain-containing protein [Eubacterium sp.]